MIKLLVTAIAIHGVWCAPQGVPFTEYGIPSGSSLAEQIAPFSKPPPGSSRAPVSLPGSLETPKYDYSQGSFPHIASPPKAYGAPKLPLTQNKLPYEQQKPAPYYSYPPDQEETGSELKDTEVIPVSKRPLKPNGDFSEGEESLGSSLSPASTRPAKPVPGPKPGPPPAAPINIPPNTSVKVQDNRGQYSHGFKTPDGTQVEETGHLISTDNGWEYVIAKEGSYSYNSPEGIPISVRYIADENGFRILSTSFAGR